MLLLPLFLELPLYSLLLISLNSILFLLDLYNKLALIFPAILAELDAMDSALAVPFACAQILAMMEMLALKIFALPMLTEMDADMFLLLAMMEMLALMMFVIPSLDVEWVLMLIAMIMILALLIHATQPVDALTSQETVMITILALKICAQLVKEDATLNLNLATDAPIQLTLPAQESIASPMNVILQLVTALSLLKTAMMEMLAPIIFVILSLETAPVLQ